MNRNVESHFAHLPKADIQRSVFDRSFGYKTSFNTGEIIPIFCQEVLPGDTMDVTTSKVVRLQTLLTPIMDSLMLDCYFFYCPNRLVWEHWKEFCGENSQSAWAPSTVYSVPTIGSPKGGFAVGSLADYLGLPVGVEWDAADECAPSALPFRGYALICNEWFRDENLTDPLFIPFDDANQVGTNGSDYVNDVANGGRPFIAAKYHDYFSSSLPNAQKGSPVGFNIDIPVPFTGQLPVTTIDGRNMTGNVEGFPLVANTVNVNGKSSGFWSDEGNKAAVYQADDQTWFNSDFGQSGSTTKYIYPRNLVVNIPAVNDSTNTSVNFTINELRLAFATQRYLEKMAYGGSRYTEILRTLFSVVAPDASLQRPEYLGGNRIALNVSEVTNNAQTDNDYLGDVGGLSSTSDIHSDFVKSFTEHGYVFGLAVVRYAHTFSQGIDRHWLRHNFLDFYQPTFANLGNMPIYLAEIYADGNTADGRSKVFGYQEAWASYRYGKDICTGEMRPGIPNSLASWHLGDYYTSTPTLSDEWIREDKTNVDRVLAVTSDVSNQIFGDFYFRLHHTRPMPMYSIPGLIDHF